MSFKSRLKKLRKKIQKSPVVAKVTRGLVTAAPLAGAFIGGPLLAGAFGLGATAIRAGATAPGSKRSKAIKRGLALTGGVAAGSALLNLASGSSLQTGALGSLRSLFGAGSQPAEEKFELPPSAFSIEGSGSGAPSAPGSGSPVGNILGQIAAGALGTEAPADGSQGAGQGGPGGLPALLDPLLAGAQEEAGKKDIAPLLLIGGVGLALFALA